MTDYEIDYDLECPKCGHTPLHSDRCQDCGDIEGTEDLSDDDPINYAPGTLIVCSGCKGHGIIRWCPGCGVDLTGQKVIDNSPEYDRRTGRQDVAIAQAIEQEPMKPYEIAHPKG